MSNQKSTVVVVTDRPLQPVDRGNRARIVSLMSALSEFGFKVILVTLKINNGYSTSKLADRIVLAEGIPFAKGNPTAHFPGDICKAVSLVCEKYTPVAVIVEYLFLAKCLKNVPSNCLKMIDTHDIMHIRCKFDRSWVTCSLREEVELLNNADVIIAIQDKEQAIFSQMLPSKKIICVGHSTSKINELSLPTTIANRVMVVGSMHPGNLGILDFIREGWLITKEICPTAELYVYGRISDAIDSSVPGVKKMGYVSNLHNAYRETKIVIAPLLNGTGLKTKIVDALSHGKALVTTTCGAEGLHHGANEAFLIEDDIRLFGDTVGRLLEDRARRNFIENKALEFARTYLTSKFAFKELISLLKER